MPRLVSPVEIDHVSLVEPLEVLEALRIEEISSLLIVVNLHRNVSRHHAKINEKLTSSHLLAIALVVLLVATLRVFAGGGDHGYAGAVRGVPVLVAVFASWFASLFGQFGVGRVVVGD